MNPSSYVNMLRLPVYLSQLTPCQLVPLGHKALSEQPSPAPEADSQTLLQVGAGILNLNT